MKDYIIRKIINRNNDNYSYHYFDKRENNAAPMTLAVKSVKVAAPSSSERPLAKETSKSLTSKDKLF